MSFDEFCEFVRVVRVVQRAPVARVDGWRNPEIERVLDCCAHVPGWSLSEVEQLERDRVVEQEGRRYGDSAAYKRQWARSNVEKARANSRLQWDRAQAGLRSEYAECLALYRSLYPDVAVPGFDTWRKRFRPLWRQDRAVAVARMYAWKLPQKPPLPSWSAEASGAL